MMMRQRCENPRATHYENYGGRGIRVCARWQKFENFLKDMGERPKGMTLDRRDNGGDYNKANCRWTTCKKQMRNSRANVEITIKGVTRCASDWAQEYGIARVTVYARITRGWDPVAAVTKPE